jgi:Na+-driven multidrug efflux pump
LLFYKYKIGLTLELDDFFPLRREKMKEIITLSIPAALQEAAFSSRFLTLYFI